MGCPQPEKQRRGPLTIAVDATFELGRFVEIAWQGLGYAEHATLVAQVLARAAVGGAPAAVSVAEQERAAKLESFAKAQTPHFSFLHSLAAFRLWAILESAVEDLIRDLLEDDSFRQRPVFRSIEGSLIEFASATVKEQCDILLNGAKQRLGASLKAGIGRFERLLDATGLGGPIDDLVRRVLMELSEARNVVAHKNGRADRRFMERCPWFGARQGEDLVVSHLHFNRYVTATGWYLIELDRRSPALRPQRIGPEEPPETVDLTGALKTLEKRLASMEAELGGASEAPLANRDGPANPCLPG